jgi:hypothetical protein
MMTRNLTMNHKGSSALEFTQLTANELIALLGKQQQFHNATNLVAFRHSTGSLTLQDAVMPLESSDRFAEDGGNPTILSQELPLKTIDPNIPSSKSRLGRDADTGARMVTGHAEEG